MYNPNEYNPNENNQQNIETSSGWQTYQSNGGQNSFQQPPFQNQEPAAAKKKTPLGLKIGALIVACALVGGGAGFGGSLLAQQLSGGDGSSPSVIKQSVVNTSDGVTTSNDVSAVASATADTVVEITTEVVTRNEFLQQYTSTGAGSGVILSSDGYIITNNHVIEDASTIKVRLRNGTEYDATLVGTDPDSDIAVIKIDATDLPTAVLGDSDQLVVGETAVAIGNPLGELGGTVTEGIISALDREITIDGNTMNLLQTSAAINPGNSGGGLFNAKGELIGIVNAKSAESGIEGLGFAIPINTASDVAQELIEHGYVTGKVQLGVSLLKIPDEETAAQYRVSAPGVYVAQVTANSDAYYGGLRAADRIISVNGTNIEETQDLKDIVESSEVGDVLNMTIDRNGEEMQLTITLTEYNSSAANFAS